MAPFVMALSNRLLSLAVAVSTKKAIGKSGI